mmetsp:Transcript_24622/g.57809  ORF Transcript_24622/g.57809 Transcript_24622/m.57809 type:complete len:150 (-) Transcript_24622:1331-1780(-)
MMKTTLQILASAFLLFSICFSSSVNAFVSPRQSSQPTFATRIAAESSDNDPNEIVAKRIVVEGDVQGGYYRSCVRNEAGRFRRLSGTMTPPDDSETAEIYVEGKRKMVNGFIRWCKKADVGLSQQISVSEVFDEDPTGLYDDFYVKMRD